MNELYNSVDILKTPVTFDGRSQGLLSLRLTMLHIRYILGVHNPKLTLS
jgi:hypothetical protein